MAIPHDIYFPNIYFHITIDMNLRLILLPLIILCIVSCTSSPLLKIELDADGILRENHPLIIQIDVPLTKEEKYQLLNEKMVQVIPHKSYHPEIYWSLLTI